MDRGATFNRKCTMGSGKGLRALQGFYERSEIENQLDLPGFRRFSLSVALYWHITLYISVMTI